VEGQGQQHAHAAWTVALPPAAALTSFAQYLHLVNLKKTIVLASANGGALVTNLCKNCYAMSSRCATQSATQHHNLTCDDNDGCVGLNGQVKRHRGGQVTVPLLQTASV
jgi:predicted lipoprotein with Yx(FWY)xxD motif